ncbi:MAG: hypothetical protein ABIJ97_04230 [Bacteroidota bacterium]
MKKIIALSLFVLIICNSFFAQSSGTLTEDEKTRIILTIPLITYDTMGNFENAAGEAYFNLVIASFKEYLIIPQFTCTLTPKDKTKIEKFIQQLNEVKHNPPSWDELFTKQTQYLIWFDKISRRQSKYKTDINP